jgi:hypothetical protein
MTEGEGATGLYTFAVLDGGSVDDAELAPRRLVAVGPIAAVVENVAVEEFEGENLERNLADRDWLERMVRHHEAVIESLLGGRAVVPMRFGSIFSTEAGLRSMLEENATAFIGMLDRVRGRTEWGVRVNADREAMVRGLAPAPTAAGSGGDYLRRRKAEMKADEEVGAEAARIAREVHEALVERAEDGVVLQPRVPDPQTLITSAYLVPFSDQDAFLASAKELDAKYEGISLDVTGPWPPYSFISADVGGPRS